MFIIFLICFTRQLICNITLIIFNVRFLFVLITNSLCIHFLLLCKELQPIIKNNTHYLRALNKVTGFSARGFHKAEINMAAGLSSFLESSREESAFELIQVVGRIQLLENGDPHFILLAVEHSQLVKVAVQPLPRASNIFKTYSGESSFTKNPSQASNITDMCL